VTSLPQPKVKEFPAQSVEKQVYGIVESLKEFLPITNDRNRLGFALCKYVKGEGDVPAITVRNAKLKIISISPEELAKKLEEKLKELKPH
jgi:ribosome maturation protein Sdo1